MYFNKLNEKEKKLLISYCVGKYDLDFSDHRVHAQMEEILATETANYLEFKENCRLTLIDNGAEAYNSIGTPFTKQIDQYMAMIKVRRGFALLSLYTNNFDFKLSKRDVFDIRDAMRWAYYVDTDYDILDDDSCFIDTLPNIIADATSVVLTDDEKDLLHKKILDNNLCVEKAIALGEGTEGFKSLDKIVIAFKKLKSTVEGEVDAMSAFQLKGKSKDEIKEDYIFYGLMRRSFMDLAIFKSVGGFSKSPSSMYADAKDVLRRAWLRLDETDLPCVPRGFTRDGKFYEYADFEDDLRPDRVNTSYDSAMHTFKSRQRPAYEQYKAPKQEDASFNQSANTASSTNDAESQEQNEGHTCNLKVLFYCTIIAIVFFLLRQM